jgi:hypothetical protein
MKRRYNEDPAFRKAQLKQVRNGERKRKESASALVEAFRINGCARCPEKTSCCLVAHHVDPSKKEGSISRMLRKMKSDKLAAELAKCVCLCANCHAKVHAGEITL